MKLQIISKEGLIVWEGVYGSRADCVAAYRDELGPTALDYDDVDPQWDDDLEIRETAMDDYELSKRDFDMIDVVFRYYLTGGFAADSVLEMHARDLFDKFRMAHTAKIIYE